MITKFLYKILLFAISWFAITYTIVIILPFHYFNIDYPIWKSKIDIIQAENNFTNYIIGDSRTIAGINPDILGKSYYNLALGGGTPVEGLFLLQRMVAANIQIDTLIISYAPFHLEHSDTFWDRQLKFNFYNIEDINTIFSSLNEDNEIFWEPEISHMGRTELYYNTLRAYLYYLKSPLSIRTEIKNSFFIRGFNNSKVYTEISERKGSFDYGRNEFSDGFNQETYRADFIPKKIMAKCLDQMIETAINNNIRVFYMSTPMNESSYNKLSSVYVSNYNGFYDKLILKYDQVDFSAKLFAYNNNLFGDPSHLNHNGRLKFSKQVKEKLHNVSKK